MFTNVESKIQYHLENDKVNIQYLRIPYDSVPDSIINIKDSESYHISKNTEINMKLKNQKRLNIYLFQM